MATGTKACGWPLMANCILHSSFVNCCLPSSHFLLGHGTKPRTGGIRNGTSAPLMHSQPLSTLFSPSLSFSLSSSLLFSLYLSLSPLSRASFYLPLAVCTPMTSPILFFPFFPFLSLLIWGLHFFSVTFLWRSVSLLFFSCLPRCQQLFTQMQIRLSILYSVSALMQIHASLFFHHWELSRVWWLTTFHIYGQSTVLQLSRTTCLLAVTFSLSSSPHALTCSVQLITQYRFYYLHTVFPCFCCMIKLINSLSNLHQITILYL